MSIVLTLLAYAPPARADGKAFVKAKIDESSTGVAGSWTTIDTLTLSPVDTDPEHPIPRDLTTTKATLIEGFYRVIWIDAAGAETAPTQAVQNTSDVAGGIRPTIANVAALLRARTKAVGGSEVGVFTTTTRPTAEQTDGLIDDALDEVVGKVQAPVAGTDYERRVRGAVALYAAILIELSYFPEQVKSDRSPAATYQKLYDSRIKALIAEGETGKPQGEGGGDSPADAAWVFPEGTRGMIGWASRF